MSRSSGLEARGDSGFRLGFGRIAVSSNRAGGAVFAWGWGPRERAGVGPRPQQRMQTQGE
jgi:hypothetical protein